VRRQAALLARIATWAEVYQTAAEELAGMELLEVAANHQAADMEFADSPALERVERGAALLNLQIARLNRTHHVVFKGRGEISRDAVSDAALVALECVSPLLEAWRSAHRPGQAPVFVEDRRTGAIDEELVATAAEPAGGRLGAAGPPVAWDDRGNHGIQDEHGGARVVRNVRRQGRQEPGPDQGPGQRPPPEASEAGRVVTDTAAARRTRAEFVARLVGEDASLSAGWRPAFERVPRHVFVPRIYEQNGRGVARVLDSSTPDDWLSEVYSDTALVTCVDARDHDTSLSSSSAPSVMWEMLDALEVEPGARVLEIGTGTGYNAALLCERLGSANVVSVEIDGELVAAAGERLAAAGYAPTVARGDGAAGYPAGAPYDRVLATCAVWRIPPAWIAQTKPGGLICAPMPYGMVRLRAAGDGSARGRFHPASFAFMAMRGAESGGEPLSVARLFELARSSGAARWTPAAAAAAVPLRSALWMLVRILAVPELAVLDLGEGELGYVDRATGAWARVVGEQVIAGGAGRVWDAVEGVYARWRDAGGPERPEIGLSVEQAGQQRLWLRTPDGPGWTLS
jgi:protein-L-isoaspartate O-methyltransferase